MRRTMFKTSNVQHSGADLPLCPEIGAAQQRRPTVISLLAELSFQRDLSRRNQMKADDPDGKR
jgi:hypothetical protein